MKVLIHSNAPWVPTGYGKQAMLAGRMLLNSGIDVSYSAFSGLQGQPIHWTVPGVPRDRAQVAVFPSGQLAFGADMIIGHAQASQADIVIPLMDTYMLMPAAESLYSMPLPFAPLGIVDCEGSDGGPGVADRVLIERTGALPAAVSRWGQQRLQGITPDWDVPVVPHAVDTDVFYPRKVNREDYGTDDKFVIGIAAANRDSVRKAFPEQFAAFARFAKKHDDARLAVHTVYDSKGGLRLDELASDMGILKKVLFVPAYEQDAGLLSDEYMANWYSSLDILSNCGYAEGFGVPLLEAQACGTPVVATDCSAMSELARPAGWLVPGDRYWNVVHRAWWTRPREDAIVKAWEKAYQEGPSEERQAKSVEFAQGYSIPVVTSQWADFIDRIVDFENIRRTEAEIARLKAEC